MALSAIMSQLSELDLSGNVIDAIASQQLTQQWDLHHASRETGKTETRERFVLVAFGSSATAAASGCPEAALPALSAPLEADSQEDLSYLFDAAFEG